MVVSDDQVESRLWWVVRGSSHTFVPESPDECARAVMGVTRQSNHSSLNNYLSSPESGPSQSPRKWLSRFPREIVHILKKFSPGQGKKGSRPVAHRVALLFPREKSHPEKTLCPKKTTHLRALPYLWTRVSSQVVHFCRFDFFFKIFFFFFFFFFFIFSFFQFFQFFPSCLGCSKSVFFWPQLVHDIFFFTKIIFFFLNRVGRYSSL